MPMIAAATVEPLDIIFPPDVLHALDAECGQYVQGTLRHRAQGFLSRPRAAANEASGAQGGGSFF